jgi:hypothetical protein
MKSTSKSTKCSASAGDFKMCVIELFRMASLSLLIALNCMVAVVNASWAKNLNYRSPSEHHPSLGISIRKVVKRNDPASTFRPSELNFTHGVASGGR